MKKIVGLASALFFVSALSAQTQASIQFCTTVQDDYCVFGNTKFISQPDSLHARLFMMVRNEQGFGSAKLVFKIYAVAKDGTEKFKTSIDQKTRYH